MSRDAYEQWKSTPLAADPFLSVIIPAYNEEARIVPTIGAVAGHLCRHDFPWELIVVDDGSRDATIPLVRGLGLTNLRLLTTGRNAGKGRAVRRGMLAAHGRYVLFTDADNSTPIEEVDRLLVKVTREGYDIAIGSRAAAGAHEANRPLIRRIASAGLRGSIRLLPRVGVRDTQCGFKLYTRAAARRLHELQTVSGFAFDLEILYLARKFGYRIAEVPVNWVEAPGSKLRVWKEVRAFVRGLAQIRVNDPRGVYVHA